MNSDRDRDDLEVWRRETEFHDSHAEQYDPAAMPPRAPDVMEAETLRLLGDLSGRDVLELGCGSGDLSLMLLAAGARLTALDISPGMLEVARARAQIHLGRTDVTWVEAPAEATALPEAAFDVVVGKYVIHHLDVPVVAAEVSRLLRSGGEAIFIENSGLNPLLLQARRRLTGRLGVPRYGTIDEHPLVEADFEAFRREFASVELVFPDFKFFRIADRQLLGYRYPRFSRAMAALDRAVQQAMPFARRYSYHLLLVARR